jgi:hypothetical protein
MKSSVVSLAILLALAPMASGCRHASQQSGPANASDAAAAGTPAPAPAPPPAPAYNGPVVQVPAGSRFMMRLDDNVDSGHMSPGQRFHATLDAALMDASGKVIVPQGTRIFGVIVDTEQAGRIAGKSEVEIAFTDLQINGQLFPIKTQGVKAVGEGSGRDTARKVGAAALIGGAFGGGSGAAKGAAIGGAAALLTRGKSVKIPAGTILELTLAAPANVPAPEQPAAVAVAVAPATPAAPAVVAVAVAPAPAAPAPAPAAAEDADKACVKKLMSNGFTADEALASCKKKGK